MHEELFAAVRGALEGGSISRSPSLEEVRRLASELGALPLEIEVAALECGAVPTRYERNIGTIGIDGQLKMLRSRIGVCGLGGLGGHVCESLSRFGAGHLVLVDGDVFEENNLNRQSLCREGELGRAKADVAGERIAQVNGSVLVTCCRRFMDAEDMLQAFSGMDLVVDALDTVSSRLALEETCSRLEIPLVHGAIAGNAGQVMTILPGDPGLKALYAGGGERGVETVVGNPPTTPALVASLQVQEAVKVICGGELLRNGFLLVDTSSNLYQFIPLK